MRITITITDDEQPEEPGLTGPSGEAAAAGEPTPAGEAGPPPGGEAAPSADLLARAQALGASSAGPAPAPPTDTAPPLMPDQPGTPGTPPITHDAAGVTTDVAAGAAPDFARTAEQPTDTIEVGELDQEEELPR